MGLRETRRLLSLVVREGGTGVEPWEEGELKVVTGTATAELRRPERTWNGD